MDLGLIERLDALKLHAPSSANGAPPATTGNSAAQRDGNQREHNASDTASLQEQFSRMAQQMQDHYERQLSEQQHALAARLQHETHHMQSKFESLEQQNQTLRQAVADADARVADQHVHIELLQNEVKQLRLTNYRLQYMVQQNDRTSGLGGGLPPPPPDIF